MARPLSPNCLISPCSLPWRLCWPSSRRVFSEEGKMNDTISGSKGKFIGWLLVFIILAVLPGFTTPYWVTLVTQMFIFGILAMSLDLMLGYSGMPSFGHAG